MQEVFLLCRPTDCDGVLLGAQGRLSSPTSEDALLARRSRLQSTSPRSCIAGANAAAAACSGPVPLPSPFASQQEQVHRLVCISTISHSEGLPWAEILSINASTLQSTHAWRDQTDANLPSL